MKLGLFGGSAEDRYDDNSSQITQNWYPYSSKKGKSKLSLYPTPGQTIFSDIGTGPQRGEINYNGQYFIVSGNQFYEVDAAGNETLKGTLNTSVGDCKLASNGANNGQQICIVDGLNGYIWNSQYSTFSQIKQFSTGTTTTTTADKLVDTGADFITDGVVAGTIVYNTTDLTKATVTAVDSATTLSVSSDVFPTGKAYEVGTDAFPNGSTHVIFFDGFFIWNDPSASGQIIKSKAYDGTDIDITDVAVAERSPDELKGILKVDRILWLVGETTAEAWHNTGARDFPFEPIQGGFSEWGTIAPYSLVEMSGLGFWISQNEEGAGLLVMASGIQVKIVSTPEIAATIDALTSITDCYSFTYQKLQHSFAAFTFPIGEKTIVYDVTENEFHYWSTNGTGFHRSSGHTFIFNKHLVGDPVSGRIYELDWDNPTDNGTLIERRRVSVDFHADEKGIDWEVVAIDIKGGVGNTACPDPKLHLRWRENTGKWSNYHSRSMGKIGETNKKLRWRQVGRTEGTRVYEIVTSDAVTAVLLDGYARIKTDSKEFR